MLTLVIAAPNKQKVELGCEPTTTFGEVKSRIEQALGVPPSKQRLLCGGKERKNDKETLAAAGVSAKSKLMLMLTPGYSMPGPQASSETSGSVAPASDSTKDAPPPVDAEGELPRGGAAASPGEGASAPGDAEARVPPPGLVRVRQGRNRYRVRVPQGLVAANFGELADYMAEAFFPGQAPAELRFLTRGRTAERADALGAASEREVTVMLLFWEAFHVAADGAAWLRAGEVDLAEAEAELEKLGRRIEANFTNEETYMHLAEVAGVVATLKQSVDSVRMRAASIPEMQSFCDRVCAADARAEELRKQTRL